MEFDVNAFITPLVQSLAVVAVLSIGIGFLRDILFDVTDGGPDDD